MLKRFSMAILGLMLLSAIGLTAQMVHATTDACGTKNLGDVCSAGFLLVGGSSAIHVPSSTSAPTKPVVDRAQALPSGPLMYLDYKALEAEARDLLKRSMAFRQDISPYRPLNNFNNLVRAFDESSGFSATYTDTLLGKLSLQARIDQADADLLRARDLYAVLAVYAPEERFRADTANPDYKNTLCKLAENPSPPDPQHSGQVLDPIIDWCNFPARLRQAVREAAYLRMIFGQQFMVDALGLHFSAGNLVGGDAFVVQEIAKLQAANYQYDLTQKELSSALGYQLGNGCFLSDFYTQTEWALLSQAASAQFTAKHNIATRLSYMGISDAASVLRAQAAAQMEFHESAAEGYVKMVGLSGLSTIGANGGTQCNAKGARPDGSIIADMAQSVIDTQSRAREMKDGRNIFGFDISFTPARPFHTANGDKGMWEQAKEAGDFALGLQQQTENSERLFDLNQQDLTKAILATNNQVDNDIQKEVGCDLQGFANDQQWYACIDDMIVHTQECDPTADTFDACMARTTDGQPPKVDGTNWLILVSDMRKARQDLRVAWLGVKSALTKRDNIIKRADTEVMRNTKVKSIMFNGAQETAALEAAIAFSQFIDFDTEGTVTFHPGAVIEAALRPVEIMRQVAHDLDIEDANSEAVVRNLFYDLAEAGGEIDSAAQQYQSMLTTFNGVVGQTGHDVYQSKREHAYTASLPANDPAYRITRDSRRLQLADALESAARQAYLAARRAEYEYATRLNANNFRISDIYKARTATDILNFLLALDSTINNLPGSVKGSDINQSDLTISVARHVLGLSDDFLQGQGFTGAGIQVERVRRFHQWVGANTKIGTDGKAVLSFPFALSTDTKGILRTIIQQGYDFYWLHKVGGIGQPLTASNGFGVNLVTAQTDNLQRREVRINQTGQVVLTALSGCQFDYRLIAPALMLGLDYPSTQPSDEVAGSFNGDVNGAHGNTAAGYSTNAFLGRPLASDGWTVTVFAGSPDGVLPDMDLQQLSDIELKISTVHATRPSNTPPQGTACVRTDF